MVFVRRAEIDSEKSRSSIAADRDVSPLMLLPWMSVSALTIQPCGNW
jgi:hypothetical protein